MCCLQVRFDHKGNEKSFQDVQFWLREVDNYSNNPKVQKVIAGNKTDSQKLVVTPDTGRVYSLLFREGKY